MDKKYVLRVNNELIEVNKEIYMQYYSEVNYVRNQNKKNKRNRLIYYNSFDNEEYVGEEFIPDKNTETVEDLAIKNIVSEKLHTILDELTEFEKELIKNIYFDEISEREFSKRINIPRKTINYRKIKLLKKLKKLLEN